MIWSHSIQVNPFSLMVIVSWLQISNVYVWENSIWRNADRMHIINCNSHGALNLWMKSCILKYSPMSELLGCSTKYVPPQATQSATKRVHLSWQERKTPLKYKINKRIVYQTRIIKTNFNIHHQHFRQMQDSLTSFCWLLICSSYPNLLQDSANFGKMCRSWCGPSWNKQ